MIPIPSCLMQGFFSFAVLTYKSKLVGVVSHPLPPSSSPEQVRKPLESSVCVEEIKYWSLSW